MTCAIFQAATAMTLIASELDALATELELQLQSFGPDKMSVSAPKEAWDWDEDVVWVTRWETVDFDVKLASHKKARTLRFRFELTREEMQNSNWEHAADALLIAAYHPRLGNEWTPEQMAIRADGRLADDDAWESCSVTISEGRVLEWAESSILGRDGWSMRSWLVAVPLCALSSPEALRDGFVAVVGGLLTDKPLSALPLDCLVKWPDAKTTETSPT